MCVACPSPHSPVPSWSSPSPQGVCLIWDMREAADNTDIEIPSEQNKSDLIQTGMFRAFQGQADLTVRLQDYSGPLGIFVGVSLLFCHISPSSLSPLHLGICSGAFSGILWRQRIEGLFLMHSCCLLLQFQVTHNVTG